MEGRKTGAEGGRKEGREGERERERGGGGGGGATLPGQNEHNGVVEST